MGRVVVSEFVTLDGVIEAPGGGEEFEHAGWSFRFDRGPEGDQFKFEELQAAGALLLGRVTYEAFASVWPTFQDEQGFADKFNSMPKFVASRTLERADWGPTTVVGKDLADEVGRAKETTEGDVLVNGSAQLVQALVAEDLVDEYRLMLFPIVLGTGKRLFGDGALVPSLRLVESRPLGPDGIMLLTYEPTREDAS